MKVYLGDGVYASEERGMIVLSTGKDTIYLEAEVYEDLQKFVKSQFPEWKRK